MMQCKQAQNLMDDYLDGYLDENQERDLVSHLSVCPECRDVLSRYQELKTEMHALPVPPVSPGFAERALRQAGHDSRVRHGFAAGFGSAVAAGLLVWFAAAFWMPSGGTGEAPLSFVALQVAQPQEVSLAFDVPHDIQDVTFRIRLPDGVDLQGYPAQKELVWSDHLKKGRNVMNLNLIAHQGTKGELQASIEHGGKERVFHIPVTASMNGVGVTRPLSGNTLSI